MAAATEAPAKEGGGPKPREAATSSSSASSSTSNALAFWFYLTVSVAFVAFCASSLPSFPAADHRSWFLALPSGLRRHYSDGKLLKLHPVPDRSPVHLFVAERGSNGLESEPAVLFLHGSGSSSFSFRGVLDAVGSIRAVAVDLPGSGFSDDLDLGDRRWRGGVIGSICDAYDEIKVKGVFWAFDRLVETGQIPYEEIAGAPARASSDPAPSSPASIAVMSRVIDQLVESLDLAPVHLVLHDSAAAAGAASWVSANPRSVRSVTLIDPTAGVAAFPSWIVEMPVVGRIVLSSRFLFAGVLRLCCSRGIDEPTADSHRLLLRGKGGRWPAAVAVNRSFNLGEWASSEAVKDLPIQILWSNMWTDKWIEEGKRAAAAVPRAKFTYHSGWRWPQEDAAVEIAGFISQFVSFLPKSARRIEEHSNDDAHQHRRCDNDGGDGHRHLHHHNDDHHSDDEFAAVYDNIYVASSEL